MTARPVRRRRRALLGLSFAVLLVVAAGALTVVGVLTLLDSEAGVAVEADDRQVIALPETPNALLAVADGNGDLTSVVVATLRPEGVGGSVVTFPVNADAAAGFGPETRSLEELFDPDDPEALRTAVEGMLAIVIERVEVVDEVALADLVAPVTPVDVDLPGDVLDTDRPGSGYVARTGRRELTGPLVVDALTAIDDEAMTADLHPLDVAVWSALADNASGNDPDAGPGPDVDGPPESVADLFARLWSGPVSARDIAVVGPAASDGSSEAVDAVVLDRRDGLLVFTQVSPALVSKPNQALSFRIEARFNETQLEASDGLFESNSELVRRLIGELLFFQANPVSSDTAPALEGAPSVTRVEVADPRFLDDLEEFAPIAFGESEVTVANRVIEGVDVVVRLGTGYIDAKLELEGDGGDDAPFAAADDGAGVGPGEQSEEAGEPADQGGSDGGGAGAIGATTVGGDG